METDGQPIELIGPKRTQPVETHGKVVATPLGGGHVTRPFLLERHGEWGWTVEGLSWPSRFGRADVTFHVDGRDGDPFPVALRVEVSGGSLEWGEPKGEPATRGDQRVAWSVGGRLDLGSGLLVPDRAPRVHLADYDRRGEEGLMSGLFQAPVTDTAFEAEVAAEFTGLIEGWAAADRGYAARIYAGLVRCEAHELEAEVEAARLAYLRASDRMGRMACAARSAENMVRFPKSPVTVLEVREGERPHAEIRGFGGEPMDSRNVDEVLAWAPESLHVETMSDTHAWMGVYLGDGRRIVVNFGIEKGKLRVAAEIDDDGLD